MSVLQGKALQEYLFRVRDLESTCYEQRQYINYLHSLAEDTRHPLLHKKANFKGEGAFSDSFTTGMVYSVLISAIVGGICCPIFNADQIGWILDVIGWAIIGILGSGLLGVVIGIPVGIICGCFGISRAKKRSRAVDIANEKLDIQNSRIVADAKKRVDLIQKEISKATGLYNDTKKVLDSYYSQDVVYKKYHGLVPITMFCEYFLSGRCNTLTGHEGAYNIYEYEVRQNIIIAKLDNIISQLESIKQNQYMLADMIQESNKEISKLSGCVERQVGILQNIEDNSTITSYYSRISAINTSYLSWLTYRNQ